MSGAGAAAASACPGCGLVLDANDGPTHPYLGASAACWALYGELLAREFGPLDYPPEHRLTMDAYAVQHPGVPERRSVQSVAVHLMSLCLVLERGLAPERATPVLGRLPKKDLDLRWLEPPRPNGTLTLRTPLEAAAGEEHARAVEAWARDVWEAWSAHHDTARGWLDAAFATAA